ncbi:hypothetical protein LX15_004164 [Streptoalloteichus tenebrarius]|uniref:Uncharacterized protein n=1 Tax=Streptoalloteichus tenebrarius (strain ATCC 17920 / DSM 40477 / JCM 4838 / CBS 697.72 / NBRC 16177 / NCIMB 11028 / NRRL B-12390 / A12253. 1 / ISP 5477) TaxID=1933 RepID=A0ABT1HY65_STRSD|nr:hypothetical protein [Streptoalloteichus tenebrarius]MCP2260446.1 hypothetical protein [Streptoalloteichus tenebrarius]BFF02758.1 hypothetical protein GCM10020241_44330 [Streptoalloteichus tenebrarius]
MPAGPAGSAGPARSVVVAMCVTAAVTTTALVVAAVLRQGTRDGGPGAGARSGSPAVEAALRCESGPCRSLSSTTVGGDRVELLGDPGGGGGRVRMTGPLGTTVFETNTVQLGARLTPESLWCAEFGRPVCVVRGADAAGELFAEVFVGQAGSWSRVDTVYDSDAGYLELARVRSPEGLPDVVTVRRACGLAAGPDCRQVVAQVQGLDGDDVGCTSVAPAREQLPGWPQVAPRPEQLVPCDY